VHHVTSDAEQACVVVGGGIVHAIERGVAISKEVLAFASLASSHDRRRRDVHRINPCWGACTVILTSKDVGGHLALALARVFEDVSTQVRAVEYACVLQEARIAVYKANLGFHLEGFLAVGVAGTDKCDVLVVRVDNRLYSLHLIK